MTLPRVAFVALVLSGGSALADAEEGPVTHTDQLVVVTPNPPILITQGQGPGTVAPAAPATASNGAPQNEPWVNVSHINGSLVKVGEREDYLIKYRKLNIATNPIGWMVGFYGLSVSYALGQNVAIRGDANVINLDNEHGYEVGLSAPIYFRRVYSGPFIEPGIVARELTDDQSYAYDCFDCSTSSSSHTLVGPEVLFGWHWTFDSGLNVAAALGVARDIGSNSGSNSDGKTDPEPVGYFRIGYAM